MSQRFPVSEEKERELIARMAELQVEEDDLVETFIRGSGKGGQKVNKTSSCVQLRHIPSGIVLRCQQSRSQAMNRFLVRRELCDRLEEVQTGKTLKRDAERAKMRRQKARRSRRTKQKLLDDKKKVGAKKQLRKKPRKD